MKVSSLKQEELKKMMLYDSDNGVFIWTNPSKYKPFLVGSVAGSPNSRGYRSIQIGKKLYREHNLVWLYCTGHFPPNGLEIDHINRVKTDNRFANLRLATKRQNSQHKPKAANRSSKFLGVSWSESRGKWATSYTNELGVVVNGGRYTSELEAAMVVEKHLRRVRGEFYNEEESVKSILQKESECQILSH